MSQFRKKILFAITQQDLDQIDDMQAKRKLSQSEYIRRAIRVYAAELKIEEYSDEKA